MYSEILDCLTSTLNTHGPSKAQSKVLVEHFSADWDSAKVHIQTH